MTILARIFRFLFWLLVLSWGVALLRRFVGWMLRDATANNEGAAIPPEATAGRRLVRDPVCGMHMAEELALSERAGNEMVHFCSKECRDQYLPETRKLAANG